MFASESNPLSLDIVCVLAQRPNDQKPAPFYQFIQAIGEQMKKGPLAIEAGVFAPVVEQMFDVWRKQLATPRGQAVPLTPAQKIVFSQIAIKDRTKGPNAPALKGSDPVGEHIGDIRGDANGRQVSRLGRRLLTNHEIDPETGIASYAPIMGRPHITDNDYIVAVTGHRSNSKSQQQLTPADYRAAGEGYEELFRQRRDELSAVGKNLVVRVGGAEGIDLLAGEAAMRVGVPLQMMLPTNAKDWADVNNFSVQDRARLDHQLAYADVGDNQRPSSGVWLNAPKLNRQRGTRGKPGAIDMLPHEFAQITDGRNAQLIANKGRAADEVAAYWIGNEQGGTYNQLGMAASLGIPITNLYAGSTPKVEPMPLHRVAKSLEAAAHSIKSTTARDPDFNYRNVYEETREATRVALEGSPHQINTHVRLTNLKRRASADTILKKLATMTGSTYPMNLVSDAEALANSRLDDPTSNTPKSGWVENGRIAVRNMTMLGEVGTAQMGFTYLHELGHVSLDTHLKKLGFRKTRDRSRLQEAAESRSDDPFVQGLQRAFKAYRNVAPREGTHGAQYGTDIHTHFEEFFADVGAERHGFRDQFTNRRAWAENARYHDLYKQVSALHDQMSPGHNDVNITKGKVESKIFSVREAEHFLLNRLTDEGTAEVEFGWGGG